MRTPDERARALVQRALDNAGMSQADLARTLGLSQKHVSQVLTGRAGLSLALLDAMLRACGYRVVLAASHIDDD